jgi:topoisomerase-4 subunit B
VESVRDEKQKAAEFSAGNLMLEEEVIDTTKRKGTKVTFIPMKLFLKLQNRYEYVIKMVKNYCYQIMG